MRYKNTIKLIRDHVDPKDKRRLSELGPKSEHNETLPLERNEKNTIYINKSGLYSLILLSKRESAASLAMGNQRRITIYKKDRKIQL